MDHYLNTPRLPILIFYHECYHMYYWYKGWSFLLTFIPKNNGKLIPNEYRYFDSIDFLCYFRTAFLTNQSNSISPLVSFYKISFPNRLFFRLSLLTHKCHVIWLIVYSLRCTSWSRIFFYFQREFNNQPVYFLVWL